MARIPYERIVSEAEKLFAKMTTAPDLDTMKQYYEEYVSFLAAAGWTPVEFDQEMAKRVDEGWEDKKTTFNWN